MSKHNENFTRTKYNENPIHLDIQPISNLFKEEEKKRYEKNPHLFDKNFYNEKKIQSIRCSILQHLFKDDNTKGIIPLFAKREQVLEKVIKNNNFNGTIEVIKGVEPINNIFENTAFEPQFYYLKKN